MFKNIFRANFFTTGLAMFAMFFGSGNLIFPMDIKTMAGEQNIWAISGLFLTAVFMPFFTLCLMLLYNGDYEQLFRRVGVLPGKIIAFTTLALIGPFGVLPRCVALSYSTFSMYIKSVGLVEYSVIACAVIFVLSIKKNDVVGIIGNMLTPILLFSLAIIIIKGLTADKIPLETIIPVSNISMFARGLVEGYKTFDIFAALFFAAAIMPAFSAVLGENLNTCKKSLMTLALKSSLVGMMLLFAVYAGLSFVAANLRGGLEGVAGDKLLGAISALTMGNTAGLMANIVVAFACLTTAISLALVSAEFFRREVFLHKISYVTSLSLTMLITLIFSLLGFAGIMTFVTPILKVTCPAVITLIVLSALNKFFGFRYVKMPVYAVFALSVISAFIW